jgi:hypothetical protein
MFGDNVSCERLEILVDWNCEGVIPK